jgi:hypothetical protein
MHLRLALGSKRKRKLFVFIDTTGNRLENRRQHSGRGTIQTKRRGEKKGISDKSPRQESFA